MGGILRTIQALTVSPSTNRIFQAVERSCTCCIFTCPWQLLIQCPELAAKNSPKSSPSLQTRKYTFSSHQLLSCNRKTGKSQPLALANQWTVSHLSLPSLSQPLQTSVPSCKPTHSSSAAFPRKDLPSSYNPCLSHIGPHPSVSPMTLEKCGSIPSTAQPGMVPTVVG